jgi:hypothetical protein
MTRIIRFTPGVLLCLFIMLIGSLLAEWLGQGIKGLGVKPFYTRSDLASRVFVCPTLPAKVYLS